MRLLKHSDAPLSGFITLKTLQADKPLDSNSKDQLGFLLLEEAAVRLGSSSEMDLLSLSSTIFLHILFSLLEDDLSLLLALLQQANRHQSIRHVLLK